MRRLISFEVSFEYDNKYKVYMRSDFPIAGKAMVTKAYRVTHRSTCTYMIGVCEVGLEFTAWDSILRVPRVRVRMRVWVRP